MMHLAARARLSDGRFEYTSAGKRIQAHPIGYCASTWWRSVPRDLWPTCNITLDVIADLEATRERYHARGHLTAAEAEACYRNYLLDTRSHLQLEEPLVMRPCQACGAWTTLRARCDDWSFVLCERHQTLEAIEKHMPIVTEIWKS